jgi:hypothetical protein
LQACPSQHHPCVQAESRRKIVDAGFVLVGTITIFAQPKKSLANHQLCQRTTILALGGFVHLLAKGLERRVAYRLWRRDRHGFVGTRLRRRWRLRTTRLVLTKRERCK